MDYDLQPRRERDRRGLLALLMAGTATGKLNAVLFGSPTTGPDPGDRPLGAGATEYLCFTASLAKGTDNAFQGGTATSTLTFTAEQTANNP